MLTDPHPFDRARRIIELLTSDIPAERETGARELSATMAVSPQLARELPELLYQATRNATCVAAAVLARPNTGWAQIRDQWGRIVWNRRLDGHTLVVREGGSGYYPVIDGHHPSMHGAPSEYATIAEAQRAAEEVVRPPLPLDYDADADADDLISAPTGDLL